MDTPAATLPARNEDTTVLVVSRACDARQHPLAYLLPPWLR